MKAINFKSMIITVLIIGMATGYVKADRQELLDKLSQKRAELEFKDITIAEALDKIGPELGVNIILSDEARWKLPQGQATRLSASLKGSLSDCLTELLNAFFMRYAISDNDIKIYPRQELEHILGRPSTKQLELLRRIYSRHILFSDKVSPEFVMQVIREDVGEVSILPYDMPGKIYEILEQMGTAGGTLPVTLAILLEHVGDMQDSPRWYLSGMDFPDQVPMIRMVDEQGFREAVLDQVIDISFRDECADEVIQRLAGWTGMELLIEKIEPSWLEGEIVVDMQNIKLRQALRNIVNSIDGEIEINIDDNRIEIFGPVQSLKEESAAEESTSAASAGEGYVGKISIPIGEGEGKYFIEFMLRERDLTEELKKLRENKIREILRKFSKAGDNALEVTFNSQPYTILN
jgi:hypothetical protein